MRKIVLRSVAANRGVEAKYRKRLRAMLDEIEASVIYWMQAAYRKAPPRLAQDAEFEESKHPRADNGQFGSGGGGLSGKEKTAVSSYSGDDFLHVNKALRAGDASDPIVKTLDSAISKGRLSAGDTLYRGITKDAAKALFPEGRIEKGAVISDKAFLSTSENEKLVRSSFGLGGVMLKIEVSGTPKGLEVSAKSRNAIEAETILPRGAKMTVLGVIPPKTPFDPVVVRVSYGGGAIAMDATPSERIAKELRELADRWTAKLEDEAPKVAEAYVKSMYDTSSRAFQQALKVAGWTVQFRMTPAVRDAFEASLAENVSLIKSIPAQYLQQVEGVVMRSYSSGRDLATMVADLKALYPAAAHRAELIARDQSNKANAVVNRARQLELGITRAKWMHSHAGKNPRPDHVAADGKEYDIAQGCLISGEYIQPGEEINCRCTSRPIIEV